MEVLKDDVGLSLIYMPWTVRNGRFRSGTSTAWLAGHTVQGTTSRMHTSERELRQQ